MVPPTSPGGDSEAPHLTNERNANTKGRRFIVIVALVVLFAVVVRAAVVGLVAAARTHGVVHWPPSKCTLPGGPASVIIDSVENNVGRHLDWGRVYVHIVTESGRALVAFDTVDGNMHGSLSESRERFPRRHNISNAGAAGDDTAIVVPCALNPAFTGSCDAAQSCSWRQAPLGGACCSGRVVLGSSEDQLRAYVREGQHTRAYFALLVIVTLCGTLCHLFVFSAQARARMRALTKLDSAEQQVRELR